MEIFPVDESVPPLVEIFPEAEIVAAVSVPVKVGEAVRAIVPVVAGKVIVNVDAVLAASIVIDPPPVLFSFTGITSSHDGPNAA